MKEIRLKERGIYSAGDQFLYQQLSSTFSGFIIYIFCFQLLYSGLRCFALPTTVVGCSYCYLSKKSQHLHVILIISLSTQKLGGYLVSNSSQHPVKLLDKNSITHQCHKIKQISKSRKEPCDYMLHIDRQQQQKCLHCMVGTN